MSVRRIDCDSDAEYDRICRFDESGPPVIREKNPLSRRDHFAMAAMTGILSSYAVPSMVDLSEVHGIAISVADALIAALDGGEG